MPMCQISARFFYNRSFMGKVSLTSISLPLVSLSLTNTGRTLYSHCQGREMESPSGYMICLNYWWLWNTQWVSNCSGIQTCHPRHPTAIFSPTATQVLSENPHSYSVFMSSLLTPTLGNISLVSCQNSTCWRSPRLDFRSWANHIL